MKKKLNLKFAGLFIAAVVSLSFFNNNDTFLVKNVFAMEDNNYGKNNIENNEENEITALDVLESSDKFISKFINPENIELINVNNISKSILIRELFNRFKEIVRKLKYYVGYVYKNGEVSLYLSIKRDDSEIDRYIEALKKLEFKYIYASKNDFADFENNYSLCVKVKCKIILEKVATDLEEKAISEQKFNKINDAAELWRENAYFSAKKIVDGNHHIKYKNISPGKLQDDLVKNLGFTVEEADYALEKLSSNKEINWYEQLKNIILDIFENAKKFSDFSYIRSYSKKGLISYLKKEHQFHPSLIEKVLKDLEGEGKIDWNLQLYRSVKNILYSDFYIPSVIKEYAEKFVSELKKDTELYEKLKTKSMKDISDEISRLEASHDKLALNYKILIKLIKKNFNIVEGDTIIYCIFLDYNIEEFYKEAVYMYNKAKEKYKDKTLLIEDLAEKYLFEEDEINKILEILKNESMRNDLIDSLTRDNKKFDYEIDNTSISIGLTKEEAAEFLNSIA